MNAQLIKEWFHYNDNKDIFIIISKDGGSLKQHLVSRKVKTKFLEEHEHVMQATNGPFDGDEDVLTIDGIMYVLLKGDFEKFIDNRNNMEYPDEHEEEEEEVETIKNVRLVLDEKDNVVIFNVKDCDYLKFNLKYNQTNMTLETYYNEVKKRINKRVMEKIQTFEGKDSDDKSNWMVDEENDTIVKVDNGFITPDEEGGFTAYNVKDEDVEEFLKTHSNAEDMNVFYKRMNKNDENSV